MGLPPGVAFEPGSAVFVVVVVALALPLERCANCPFGAWLPSAEGVAGVPVVACEAVCWKVADGVAVAAGTGEDAGGGEDADGGDGLALASKRSANEAPSCCVGAGADACGGGKAGTALTSDATLGTGNLCDPDGDRFPATAGPAPHASQTEGIQGVSGARLFENAAAVALGRQILPYDRHQQDRRAGRNRGGAPLRRL